MTSLLYSYYEGPYKKMSNKCPNYSISDDINNILVHHNRLSIFIEESSDDGIIHIEDRSKHVTAEKRKIKIPRENLELVKRKFAKLFKKKMRYVKQRFRQNWNISKHTRKRSINRFVLGE